MKHGMRWLSGVMAVLFTLSAMVQWNDPDPLRWILAYGIAASLSLAAAWGRLLFVPSVAAALLFGCGFLWFAPTLLTADAAAFSSFEMRAAEHEFPREALGLALCTIWSVCLAIHARRKATDRLP